MLEELFCNNDFEYVTKRCRHYIIKMHRKGELKGYNRVLSVFAKDGGEMHIKVNTSDNINAIISTFKNSSGGASIIDTQFSKTKRKVKFTFQGVI